MPELTNAVVATLAAVLGYIAKAAHERFKAKRARRSRIIDELRAIQGLLDEGRSVFQSQNYLARRLMKLVDSNHRELAIGKTSFDEKFCATFAVLNPEEAELHALIRATTMNSMNKINTALDLWIEKNKPAFHEVPPSVQRDNLVEDLAGLKLHLNQWFDKFNALIPNDPRRALVYLADEKQQGIGFPSRLSSSVEDLLIVLAR